MSVKVTVVVPVYNVEKYLPECVCSLTAQTYPDIEILLVDDGSTDASGALCDALAAEDARIRVIHKENGGAASARNLGIDEAAGEYVLFIDSDDWLDTDAIECLVGYADENKTDVLRFNYVREFLGKQLKKTNTLLEERLYTGEECKTVCRRLLGLCGEELAHPESMNFLASCGFNLYRTALLREIGVRFVSIKEYGAFVDGLFNLSVFLRMERFAFIDRPFYHYRKTNAGAATANYRKNYAPRQLLLFDALRKTVEREGAWEYFKEAHSNRIALSTMEIAFNAMRNKEGFLARYREIRGVLWHKTFRAAYRGFSLKHFGLKWKLYYFFAKHGMTLPLYLMTSVALKLKNKGVL